MKKAIKSIMMLFVASSFILASCGTDTEVKDVELTLIGSGSTSFFIGDTLKVTINGTGDSENKLKNLTITKAIVGQPTVTWENKAITGTSLVYTLRDTFATVAEAGTITYTVTLTGEKGTAQTKSITVTVSEEGFIEVATSPVQMFGHTYNGPRFCQLTTFRTYTLEQATADTNAALKNEIDLVSYFGSSNKFTISSPSDAVMQGLYSGLSAFWTSGNARATGLVKVNGQTQFNTISAPGTDRLLVPFAAGKTYGQTVTQLTANDLILFKTKEGKLGLIKVASVSGTNSDEAQVMFDCLAQVSGMTKK